MSKIVIAKTSELTREEWLMLRKKGIGGSDAAAVCGMSRWKGALDIYLEKTNPEVEPQEDNEAMYWGRTMEPILRDEFSKRTGLIVVPCPIMFAVEAYPYIIADIDGVVTETDGTKALLEIKTANGFAEKEWLNGMPPEYYIQIQHYLAVTDLPKAYVAVLIGGQKFRYEEVARDEDTIQTIIAMEAAFWNEHVLKKIPPAPDSTSGTALDMLYPRSDKTSVILNDEADQCISLITDAKNIEENMKKAVAEAENKLKAMLKGAECGKTPGGYSVHWKSSQTSRIDSTKLRAEQPEIAAKYTKTTSSRRFSITAPKAEK